jgi:alpha-maltose-1-phosphate synthase
MPATDPDAIRVLFVNENIGGHATNHRVLAEALADDPRIGFDILDVPLPGLRRRALAANVPGLSRLDADLQRVRSTLTTSLAAGREVARRLRDGDYDAIHVMSQNAALTWPRLLRSMPSVVALDSTNKDLAVAGFRTAGAFTNRSARLEGRLERPVLTSATIVAPLSEWAAGHVRDLAIVPEGRIRVCPFGIPIPAAGPRPAGARTRVPDIVFVGRYLRRKGALELIEMHQRQLRDRCRLTLITPEPVRPRPGLRVISDLVPGDPRLWDVLAESTLSVFPSQIDKSPNAVLEAMAAGLPVVAFDAGAVAEMVRDGVGGRIVAPGDYPALGRAILSMLEDPTRAAGMGRAARERVTRDYDVRLTARRRVDILFEAREIHRERMGGSA